MTKITVSFCIATDAPPYFEKKELQRIVKSFCAIIQAEIKEEILFVADGNGTYQEFGNCKMQGIECTKKLNREYDVFLLHNSLSSLCEFLKLQLYNFSFVDEDAYLKL